MRQSTCHPTSRRENLWESLRASSSAAKKSTSERSWKIVCLPGLFTSKLHQGPFCREKMFCWSCCKLKLHASRVSIKPWRLVVRGISCEDFFKLASMELCAKVLNNFTRLQNLDFGWRQKFWMKAIHTGGEVVPITTYGRLWLSDLSFDEAWNVIHENYEHKFASSWLQLIKLGRSRYLLRFSKRLVSLSLLFQ